MPTSVTVTARDGETHRLEIEEGVTLMEALRDGDFGVQGTCGGMCSCGTCHVYVDGEAPAAIEPVGEDERDMLDALADVVAVKPNSRLSCQITITPALEGLGVTVAEQL